MAWRGGVGISWFICSFRFRTKRFDKPFSIPLGVLSRFQELGGNVFKELVRKVFQELGGSVFQELGRKAALQTNRRPSHRILRTWDARVCEDQIKNMH